MKKCSLLFCILLFFLWCPHPEARSGVKVIIDDTLLDSSANHLFEGKTYVDLSAYARKYGLQYTLHPLAKTATIDGIMVPIRQFGGVPTVHIRKVAQLDGNREVSWDHMSGIVELKQPDPSLLQEKKTWLFLGWMVVMFTLFYGIIGTKIMRYKTKYKMLSRVKKLLPSSYEAEEKGNKEKRPIIGWSWIVRLAKQFKGIQFIKRWEKELEQAGLPLKAEEFFVLRVLIFAVFLVLSFMLGYPWWVSFPLAVGGFLIAASFVKHKRKKRLHLCAVQLPVALGVMSTAMRAGFSFIQAMQLVGKEVPDPIGTEFTRTLREINFGVSFENALTRLLERLPNRDLELVVTALLVQRTTGGNLTSILDSMQETVLERVKMKEDLKTLTAQGRLSAYIISLLPILLGFILNLINPAYFQPMFTHPLGWVFICFGVITGLIGWFSIQKIVRIEV